MSDRPYGTHMQRQRPRGGWPNTSKPEVKPGRKIRKAREKLARRIKAWEDLPASKKDAYHKPGSLKTSR